MTHFHGLKMFFSPLKITRKHHGIPLSLEFILINKPTFDGIPGRFIIVRLEILYSIMIAQYSLLSGHRPLLAARMQRLFMY